MRPLISSLLLYCCAIPLAAQPANNSWYVVRIGDSPVGWMHETRADSAGAIRWNSTMYMALNRLGSQVVMETVVASVESRTGVLRALDVGTRMSEQRVNTSVAVNGRVATVSVEAGARRFDKTVDLPDTPLGREAAQRLTMTRLRAVGDSVRYGSWDPQANAPATVTRVVTGRDSLLTVVERSTTSPLVTTMRLDATGRPAITQFDFPFGRVSVVLADSVTAMAANGGGSLAEESYTRTLVRTGIKLPRSREIDTLRVRLALTDTAGRLPDLTAPGQRVIARNGTTGGLEITRRYPRVRGTFPVASTPALREYLEPNAYVQSDEPRLVALAKRIVGTERDLFTAALALERWVADSMHFDLGVAFAPSVEVFERRRGTCVAYATLLATLTRAVGIPSRIAMGYVYVNGIFGGHAWAEVLVGGDWIPIDAAIVARGPADAARFAFAWSSMADGPGSLTSGAAVELYGRLRATVESFTIAGARRDVPLDAKPYVVDGDRYVNEWLGIEVTKPAGFRFVELDETWPSNTIVGMERGAERVRVVASLRAPWELDASQDAISVGLDTWRIEVESPNRQALMAEVRRGLRIRDAGHRDQSDR
jgi:transglutaminase-like putative cysteine protease